MSLQKHIRNRRSRNFAMEEAKITKHSSTCVDDSGHLEGTNRGTVVVAVVGSACLAGATINTFVVAYGSGSSYGYLSRPG